LSEWKRKAEARDGDEDSDHVMPVAEEGKTGRSVVSYDEAMVEDDVKRCKSSKSVYKVELKSFVCGHKGIVAVGGTQLNLVRGWYCGVQQKPLSRAAAGSLAEQGLCSDYEGLFRLLGHGEQDAACSPNNAPSGGI
jgi:hypothetical protein